MLLRFTKFDATDYYNARLPLWWVLFPVTPVCSTPLARRNAATRGGNTGLKQIKGASGNLALYPAELPSHNPELHYTAPGGLYAASFVPRNGGRGWT